MSADMPEMSARQAAGLLPKTRFGGPIAWLLGILIALVVISAAGGLALRNLADNARSDLSGLVTVQILEANPQTRSERAQAAASVLASQPGVTSVRVIPEQELLELLKPWLGTGVMSEDIPIPALLDVELNTGAGPEAITRLQAALDRQSLRLIAIALAMASDKTSHPPTCFENETTVEPMQLGRHRLHRSLVSSLIGVDEVYHRSGRREFFFRYHRSVVA